MAPASFGSQVAAVFLKDCAIQRRAWLSGLVKVGLPIGLLLVLLAVQWLVDKELTAPEYQCGCQCLECCERVQDTQYQCFNTTPTRPCPPQAECKAFNDSNCGLQYSSYTQVAFCPVPKPPTWPPLLQLPAGLAPLGVNQSNQRLQLGDDSAAVTLLYTGQDKQLAARLTQAMIPNTTGVGARMVQAALMSPRLREARLGPGPLTQLDLCNLTTAQPGGLTSGSNAAALARTLSGMLRGTSPPNTNNTDTGNDPEGLDRVMTSEGIAQLTADFSQVLANLSLVLGTPADTGSTLLLEPAFVAGTQEFGAAGNTASSSGGGGGGSFGPPTGGSGFASGAGLDSKQVQPLYLLTDCSALLEAGGPDLQALRQLSCGMRLALGVPVLCASLQPYLELDARAIDERVFCAWKGSACASDTAPDADQLQRLPPDARDANSSSANSSQGRRRRLRQTDDGSNDTLSAAIKLGSLMHDRHSSRWLLVSADLEADVTAGATVHLHTSATRRILNSPSIQRQPLPSALLDWGPTSVSPEASKQKPGLDVAVWFNNTNFQASIAPDLQRWSAAINLASNAYLSTSWADAHATQQEAVPAPPQLHLEGVKGFPSAGGPLSLDLATLLGPLFIMWVLQLPLPMIVAALSAERVGGQRALMMRQGLRYGAAAVSTYVWWLLWYTAFTAVFVVFGWGAGLNFFTTTAPGIQVLLYLVWFHAMYALACWLAVFYTELQNAVLASIALLIFSGMVANLVVVQFVESGPAWLAVLLEALAPPFALFRGLWEVSQYAFLADTAGGTGLTFDKLADPGNGFAVALGLLAAHTAIGVWSAFYWEHVFVESKLGGRRLHPFFPLGFMLKPDDPHGWDWFLSQAHAAQSRVGALLTRVRTREVQAGDSPAKSSSVESAFDGALLASTSVLIAPPPAASQSAAWASDEAVVSVLAGVPPRIGPDAVPAESRADSVCARRPPPLGRLSEESHITHSSQQSKVCEAGLSTSGRHVLALATDVEQEMQRVEAAWQLLVGQSALGTATGRAASAEVAASGLPSPEALMDGRPPTPAVLMRGVQRVFKSFKSRHGHEVYAVKGLWLCVDQGECFGLLGPNGAGKTTTLRMMQGLLEPTSGGVMLCGHDIAREPHVTGSKAGICPQHDVLWPSLSAEEHLHCYGRLRGLKGDALKAAVSEQLQLLGLTDEHQDSASPSLASRPCSSFSGGMRRRLSVGCALLGHPAVVFLDEPSAGLDPTSRAALWQAVRAARAVGNTSIILTTHSMREAESLCDRLGVFVGGQLQCVGSAQELTRRYADTLLLNIACAPSQSTALQAAILAQVSPDAMLMSAAGGAHQWELPKHKVDLARLFASVKAFTSSNGQLHVTDWSIHSASLDQVFNAIVAAQEGSDV